MAGATPGVDAGGSADDSVLSQSRVPYVVVGGGIAGVTCAEMLSSLCPEEQILLLSTSPLVKAVTNFRKVGKVLETFDVEEHSMSSLSARCPNVAVRQTTVTGLFAARKQLLTAAGTIYNYNKLCLCAGGSPKIVAKDDPCVLGLRDTESAQVLQKRLSDAQRIMVIGNGGIATELVFEVEGCEVIWAIKDDSITSTFVDAGAAKFLLPVLSEDKPTQTAPLKRTKYKTAEAPSGECQGSLGSALGPDWHEGLQLHGSKQKGHQVFVEYKVEMLKLLKAEDIQAESLTVQDLPGSAAHLDKVWPVYVQLSNGKIYGCDFVVSATGVTPNVQPFLTNNDFDVSPDGGFSVNDNMLTSVPDVYAAGDICTAQWQHADFWLQMRLWSQARQMGAFAAQCMVAHTRNQEISLDFCFELFAHVTNFFNYKVILLGKFNAQGLGADHELFLRVTKGVEYVKTVMKNGRMYGAILIGETDLEETFENLILNQVDLSALGEHILDPDIDIEDYFD